jgi:hypothetical protein
MIFEAVRRRDILLDVSSVAGLAASYRKCAETTFTTETQRQPWRFPLR